VLIADCNVNYEKNQIGLHEKNQPKQKSHMDVHVVVA